MNKLRVTDIHIVNQFGNFLIDSQPYSYQPRSKKYVSSYETEGDFLLSQQSDIISRSSHSPVTMSQISNYLSNDPRKSFR